MPGGTEEASAANGAEGGSKAFQALTLFPRAHISVTVEEMQGRKPKRHACRDAWLSATVMGTGWYANASKSSRYAVAILSIILSSKNCMWRED